MGGTFVNLTTSIVKKMEYVVPSLGYQDEVVEIFKKNEKLHDELNVRMMGIISLRNAISI